jgi:hypothetical protein
MVTGVTGGRIAVPHPGRGKGVRFLRKEIAKNSSYIIAK